MKFSNLTVATAAKLLRRHKLSAVELTRAFLDQAEKINSLVGAFITISGDVAIKQAKRADQRIAAGEKHPLLGIPFCLKDTYVTKEVETTAGSSLLSGFIPPYDATVYQLLKDVGAVLIGKNSQDSWGHGATNENTDLVVARNPWDLSRTAGGSSGGSAVALAVDAALFAIGEDTGGSIRLPASFCNISGLKVTYGLVSRYGNIAYGSSLDTVGPMARSVYDCALVLNTIARPDPKDATTFSERPQDYLSNLDQKPSEIKVGIAREYFSDSLDQEIAVAIEEAIKQLKQLGVKVVEVSLPYLKFAVSTYYLLAWSETSSNLARYDGIRYGKGRDRFTNESRRRILLGTFALSAGYADEYYRQAQKVRTLITNQFNQVFEKVDLLVAPVSPEPPYRLGEVLEASDPLKVYLADALVCAVNPAGIPSLALPCGFTSAGLPIGMQLIGPAASEERLLQVGHAFQKVTDWHRKKPKMIDKS